LNRLRRIFLWSVPVLSLVLILAAFIFPDASAPRWFLLAIGSSLIGASAVLLFERRIVGDPLDRFYDKLSILLDARESGLERVILRRTEFVHGQGIVEMVRGTRDIQMQGMVLGFVVQNEALLSELDRCLEAGGTLQVFLSHPASATFTQRDLEEHWNGMLRARLHGTVSGLLGLKRKYLSAVTVYVFTGEVLNTLVTTENRFFVHAYVFGEKGWKVPAMIFTRGNSIVDNAFLGQFDRIKAFGQLHPATLIEIQSETDLENLFNATG
jgi:hypothetical protein